MAAERAEYKESIANITLHLFEFSNFKLEQGKFLSSTVLSDTKEAFSVHTKKYFTVSSLLSQLAEQKGVDCSEIVLYSFTSINEGDCVMLDCKLDETNGDLKLEDLSLSNNSTLMVVLKNEIPDGFDSLIGETGEHHEFRVISSSKEAKLRCFVSDTYDIFKAKIGSILGFEEPFVLVNKSSSNNLILDTICTNRKTGETLSLKSMRLSRSLTIVAAKGDGTAPIENTQPINEDINIIVTEEDEQNTQIFSTFLIRNEPDADFYRFIRRFEGIVRYERRPIFQSQKTA